MMKQEADLDSEKQIYLTCEKYYIFELLIFAAGMMGAYTFNLRGGVFCNAQTANVVLMALAFGKGEIANGVYYLIPISAYIAGAAISEILPRRVRKIHFLRWDTYLVGFEMLILFLIGFLPLSVIFLYILGSSIFSVSLGQLRHGITHDNIFFGPGKSLNSLYISSTVLFKTFLLYSILVLIINFCGSLDKLHECIQNFRHSYIAFKNLDFAFLTRLV